MFEEILLSEAPPPGRRCVIEKLHQTAVGWWGSFEKPWNFSKVGVFVQLLARSRADSPALGEFVKGIRISVFGGGSP